MKENEWPVDFVIWVTKIVIVLFCIYGMKNVFFKMAQMALDAQEHQMSWGKFSHQMWSLPKHMSHKD